MHSIKLKQFTMSTTSLAARINIAVKTQDIRSQGFLFIVSENLTIGTGNRPGNTVAMEMQLKMNISMKLVKNVMKASVVLRNKKNDNRSEYAKRNSV